MEAEMNNFPVRLMCKTLALSPSGFYSWLKRGCNPPKARRDKRILSEIRLIHSEARETYGSPRMTDEMQARGHTINRKRIARIMQENGIQGIPARKFKVTTDSKHRFPLAENKLKQRFDVKAPNKVWASDITYISTSEGWMYLAVVMDLYSRRIIGWSMDKRMETSLVSNALNMALGMRELGDGMMHHSDRGVQYCSNAYRALLEKNGIAISMSRKACCWDNAVVESFFGTLKQELVYRCRFATRASARVEVEDYIEVFYNRTRRHSTLGSLSPANFEAMYPKGKTA
jgi:transposase InsO family protein